VPYLLTHAWGPRLIRSGYCLSAFPLLNAYTYTLRLQVHLRGRSVDFDPEEEKAKKQEKLEQKKKKMWKANAYISTSIIATLWVEEEEKMSQAEDALVPKLKEAKKQWTCTNCTFANALENLECEMCNTAKGEDMEIDKGKEKATDEVSNDLERQTL
jgi:hypothetical protein